MWTGKDRNIGYENQEHPKCIPCEIWNKKRLEPIVHFSIVGMHTKIHSLKEYKAGDKEVNWHTLT